MGLKPSCARVVRALRRVVRRRPLRGVVTITPSPRLTRWDLLALRWLGLVPGVAGGDGTTEPPADPARTEPARPEPARPEPARTEPAARDPAGDSDAERYRRRAEEAERKLEERDDADRTELQRATKRAEKAEGQVAELQTELWRLRAQRQHGLSDELTEFLTGATEEEVLSQAERLAKHTSSDGGGKVPTPKRGATKEPTPDLDEQIAEAQSRGDWEAAGRLKAQKLAAATATQN